MIGPISLDMKRMGARSAGNPHAACDVEGAGNVAQSNSSAKPARQSSTLLMSGEGKRTATQHRAPPRLYRASPSCICYENRAATPSAQPSWPGTSRPPVAKGSRCARPLCRNRLLCPHERPRRTSGLQRPGVHRLGNLRRDEARARRQLRPRPRVRRDHRTEALPLRPHLLLPEG